MSNLQPGRPLLSIIVRWKPRTTAGCLTPPAEPDPNRGCSPMPSPGDRLRAAWTDRPIMIPGAFNALTAKLAERLGFAAVYLSGGALSAGWAGLPDIGLLTLTEFAAQAAVLARATTLPVLCDADTG